MNIQIKPLHPDFQAPRYATAGSAGFDFHALEAGAACHGVVTKVSLGCSVAVPEGAALLLTARSGHGLKYGAGVPHGYGLIDSDYRGELFMVFVCASSFSWKKGDRIAQGIVVPVAHCRFDLVAELPPTARGANGFGSTGA